jgi:hypothetical protein
MGHSPYYASARRRQKNEIVATIRIHIFDRKVDATAGQRQPGVISNAPTVPLITPSRRSRWLRLKKALTLTG